MASMTLRTDGSLGCDRSGRGTQHPQSARNSKNTASLQIKNNYHIEYGGNGAPAALNHTTQHRSAKAEQCDFADTDEFYNSLIEKANKKNVNSINFHDIQQNSKASFNNTLLQQSSHMATFDEGEQQ